MTAPKITGPTPCRGNCGNTLRPSGSRAERYPGTIEHRKLGKCKSCNARTQPDGTILPPKQSALETTPEACSECESPMRPGNALVAEYPGTVRHIGSGVCARCREIHGPGILDPEAARPDFDVVQARAALQAWLADRGRRVADVHHLPAPTADTEQVAA